MYIKIDIITMYGYNTALFSTEFFFFASKLIIALIKIVKHVLG